MTRNIWAALAGCVALAWSGAANACRVPTPSPHPMADPQAILLVRATDVTTTDGVVKVRMRVENLVSGQYEKLTYDLEYSVPGGGMCYPPGPVLAKGDQVVLYLAKAGQPIGLVERQHGWMKPAEAYEQDPRLADRPGLTALPEVRALIAKRAAQVAEARRIEALPPIRDPSWLMPPRPRDIAEKFPDTALRDGIGGAARLNCLVGAMLWLRDCRVDAESPQSYGFGAAAQSISPPALVSLPASHGLDVIGRRVAFTVNFPIEPQCPLPKVKTNDLVVMFGAYQGSGRRRSGEHPAMPISVHIEPGAQPIYLMLRTHEPVRWRLTGATQRVRLVVASSLERGLFSASSVGGVAAEKVVVNKPACGRESFYRTNATRAYQREAEETMWTEARDGVVKRLGRRPDFMIAGGEWVSHVSLPSGRVEP